MAFKLNLDLPGELARFASNKRIKQAPLFQKDMFFDAQQAHRFFLNMHGIKAAYISNVERPSYSIGTEPYVYLNHKLNYPGLIEWSPISLTIREIYTPEAFGSVLSNLMAKLTHISYETPTDLSPDFAKNISKQNLTLAMENTIIESLDHNGVTHEAWKLHGAMITSLKPSRLSYEEDSLTGIDVTITYDWADYAFKGVFL